MSDISVGMHTPRSRKAYGILIPSIVDIWHSSMQAETVGNRRISQAATTRIRCDARLLRIRRNDSARPPSPDDRPRQEIVVAALAVRRRSRAPSVARLSSNESTKEASVSSEFGCPCSQRSIWMRPPAKMTCCNFADSRDPESCRGTALEYGGKVASGWRGLFAVLRSIIVVPCVDQHGQHAQNDNTKCHKAGDQNIVVHDGAILRWRTASFTRGTALHLQASPSARTTDHRCARPRAGWQDIGSQA